MLRVIGRPGIGCCEMCSPRGQTVLHRTVRITLNMAATRATCSDTSSPSGCMALPHFGQVVSASSTSSSRGRCAGNASFGEVLVGAFVPDCRARRASATPRSPVRFSNWVSSRVISRSNCSDLRPNCMRLSLSICALSCSISRSRSASWARASASKARRVSTSSGSSAPFDMGRSLRIFRAVYNMDSAAVRRGCRQSMPSSNIDSCAVVR
ncbi:hypothetical protein R54767_05267 [Paraburkholderia gardini]|uniref:Uncharacterized protein n=1 Tax=Paraburkholderia gardini TaxID=2823469 RepID=A0ABN7QS74_9BURK|nr:hypothetical protein R54767_05267 [Paraburkholderia gardini]